MGRFTGFLLVVLVALAVAGAARGMTLRGGSMGGLMQQPSSQYYLAAYGAYAETGREDRLWVNRVMYVERPKFKNAGFVDQESGVFAMTGGKVGGGKGYGIEALAGAGRMMGYVAKLNQDGSTSSTDRESFAMPGLSFALDLSVHGKRLDAGIGHQLFVGFADKAQTESLVAWPYAFFWIWLGVGL